MLTCPPMSLHFVEVARVGRAVQRRRAGKPELRGRKQRERRDVAPTGEGRRGKAGRQFRILDRRVGRVGVRMRAPLAGSGRRGVRRTLCRAIVLAQRQHGLSRRGADCYAASPGGFVAHATQRRLVGVLDQSGGFGFLRWRAETGDDASQHRVGGSCDRSVWRSARCPGAFEVVHGVARGDRVQRVMHRTLHHRDGPCGLDGVLSVCSCRLRGGFVPLENFVRVSGLKRGRQRSRMPAARGAAT